MSPFNKHLLESPESLVVDSLQGLCGVNPQLALDVPNKVVYMKDHDRSKVTLVCGGGSGHEPAHAGFVGKGMLTSAVCGNIFASPNASQVRRGIDLVSSDKGTVIIVKNYTGDILNFGLAKEQYAASHPENSEKLKFVIVGDDVAVGREQGKIVGRRGLAGTVLVYKIAGALAERNGSLDEVYSLATWLSSRLATIGVSLGHTHVPGTATNEGDLSKDEIEVGLGIHNESGHNRISPIPTLSALVSQVLDLLTSKDPDRNFVPFNENGRDDVVVLVNNLGSISELEFGGVVGEVQKQFSARGFNIKRLLAGTYMTSLNMPGVSVTLLLLPRKNEQGVPADQETILSLLDDVPDVPGWRWASKQPPQPREKQQAASGGVNLGKPSSVKIKTQVDLVRAVESAARALIAAEPEITQMDSIAGDGDCGLTLKAGAEAVLAKVKSGEINGDDLVRSVQAIAQVAEEAMGGTSGALYSVFFSGLAQGLQATLPHGGDVTAQQWGPTLQAALERLYSYTRARPPSRTLVDPLDAFVKVYSQKHDYASACEAAGKAAEETKNLVAKAGRSAYVEGDRLKKEAVPDPGAWGVKVIFEHM